MRILVVGPSYTKSKGGMQTVVEGIVNNEYLNTNFKIDFYASYIGGNILKRLFYQLFAFVKFIFIFSKYDIFHLHMAAFGSTFRIIYYLRLLKKFNKKVIIHHHGGHYKVFMNDLSTKKVEYIKNHLQRADIFIALSEGWKIYFEKDLGLSNVLVIKNSIEVSNFEKCRVNLEDNKNSFLFLGNIGENKGVYDLLKAIKELVLDKVIIKCYVAGHGEIKKFRNMVIEENLETYIEVVGWANFTQKKELLSKVGTLLLPSYNEAMPMVLLEAMAAGKALISTNVGAIPEIIIPEKNGFIIKPGDISALKECMKTIIDNPEILKVMSENNINKVTREYNSKIVYKRLEECYSKLAI